MTISRHLTALALALVLPLVPATGALADASGATVDKTGWWNRANTTTSTPAGPVTIPPPPGVPEDDLVVGAAGGEPSALTGIGIQPDADPGATVREFTLTVREDPDARGNQGTSDAAIVACPIISFWAGGSNGDWETRPEFDCETASVPGERDDEGTWTFDLRPVGELWFDTFGTIRPDGVVLVVGPDSDASFQAVFLGGEGIDVVLEAEESAEDDDNPFALPTQPDPPSDVGLNSGPSGGSSSVFSPPSVASPPTTRPAPSSTPTPAVDTDGPGETAAPLPSEPAARRSPSRAGDLLGNLPPAALLLAPLALLLLLSASYWLGPAGEPVTTVRQRGVSRALAAHSRTKRI